MKNILILSILFTYLFAGVEDDKTYLIKEYQDMFYKISQKRVGLKDEQIVTVKTPFVTVVKKKGTKGASQVKKTQTTLVLDAILGNRVMINGNWYKLYQNIGDYKIISIVGDSVYIRGNDTKQKLTIRKKNANIKIK